MSKHSRRQAMRIIGGIGLVGTLGTGTAAARRGGSSNADIFAPLSHGESQQDPDRSGSTGFVTFSETDDGTLEFELTARNVEGVTQVHIHEAPRGEIGGVVAFLARFTGKPDGSGGGEPEDGPIDKTGEVTDSDLVADILDEPGDYYVNLHTVANVAGEIRGQLRRKGNRKSSQ